MTGWCPYKTGTLEEQECHWDGMVTSVFEVIKNIPTCDKLATNLQSTCNQLATDDLISRQTAIQEIKELPNCPNGYSATYDKAWIIGVLEAVPSALPEPLTDVEQRIFLKAISREKEVCKKTDEEYSGELNLAGVCNEIERKVKGALWT